MFRLAGRAFQLPTYLCPVFLSSSNTWITGDIMVNGATNTFQIDSAVTTLQIGNVVVVWSSFNQVSASSLRDVYAQIFSPDGQKIGSEFLVNQFTAFNQRTPRRSLRP